MFTVANVSYSIGKGFLANVLLLCITAMAICASIVANADTWTDPETGVEWRYRVYKSSASVDYVLVASPSEANDDIVVPRTLRGYPVTGINASAFSYCKKVKSVTVPDCVTDMASGVFWECPELTSVSLPDSITNFGDHMFYGCSNLRTVKLPSQLGSLPKFTFYGCSSLSDIALPAGITEIGEKAFYGCKALKSVDVPDSIVKIGPGTFNGCSALVSVELPPNLRTIEESLFEECRNLISATIPSGVTNVKSRAFYYCSKLRVAFPSTVKTIGSYACYRCYAIRELTLPDSVQEIYGHAFAYCTGIDRLTLPIKLSHVRGNTFVGCTSLLAITLPNSITELDENAFGNCTSLHSVYIPARLLSIPSTAFDGCSTLRTFSVSADNPSYSCSDGVLYDKSALTLVQCPYGRSTSLAIPGTVTNIGRRACYNCAELPAITLPSSLRSIDSYAFSGCTSLIGLTIPPGVRTIGTHVFDSCMKLRSLVVSPYNSNFCSQGGILFSKDFSRLLFFSTAASKCLDLPDELLSIDESAFDCSRPTSLAIPQSVTNLTVFGSNFRAHLTNLVLKAGVTAMSDGLCAGCRSLRTVTLPETLEIIGVRAFQSCVNLEHLSLPNSLKSIGEEAFSYCSVLAGLDFPAVFDTIGVRAFWHCDALASLSFEGDAPTVGYNAFQYVDTKSCYLSVRSDTLGWDVDGDGKWYGMTINYRGDYPDGGPYYATFDGADWTYFVLDGEAVVGGADLHEEMSRGNPLLIIPPVLGGRPVTVIGSGAMPSCWEIETISIPASVSRIEPGAFSKCRSIREFVVDVANLSYSAVDGVLYDRDQRVLVAWPKARSDARCVMLPSVTNIADMACYDCYMNSVEYPDGLVSVGESAFARCVNMTSVHLPDSVQSVAHSAYTGCDEIFEITVPPCISDIRSWFDGTMPSLRSIVFTSGVTNIAAGMFVRCESLTNICVASGNVCYRSVKGVLFDSDGLRLIAFPSRCCCNYAVPAGVIEICDYAFYGSLELCAVEFPDDLVSLGEYAFAECPYLTYVELPHSMGLSYVSDTVFPPWCEVKRRVRIVVSHEFASDEYDGNYHSPHWTFEPSVETCYYGSMYMRDAGTYPITAQASEFHCPDSTYIPEYVIDRSRDFVISRRRVDVVALSDQKIYDGTPLTAGYRICGSGFVGDECQVETVGSQTEVGSSPNTVKITWLSGGCRENYDINLIQGSLTVLPLGGVGSVAFVPDGWSSAIKVENSWLEANGISSTDSPSDIRTQLAATGANGIPRYLSYVLGLDAESAIPAEKQLKVEFAGFDAEGLPIISFSPKPNVAAHVRYTQLGKISFSDAIWGPITDANRSSMRFFRVEAEVVP